MFLACKKEPKKLHNLKVIRQFQTLQNSNANWKFVGEAARDKSKNCIGGNHQRHMCIQFVLAHNHSFIPGGTKKYKY
jgi:hypothetical protein